MNIKFGDVNYIGLLILIVFLSFFGLILYHFDIYGDMEEEIFEIHYSASFFSSYKLLVGVGFSTLFLGLFFNVFMGGYYEKLKNDIVFRHSLLIFLLRCSIFILSALCFYFSEILFPYPENYIEPEKSLFNLDNIIGLVILLFISISIFKQYKDRNDCLKFSKNKIEFYDNDSGKFEFSPENVKIVANIEKRYESDGKVSSSDIKSFTFNDKNKREIIFDLDSTSLSSRGELIKEELEKLFNVDENFTN